MLELRQTTRDAVAEAELKSAEVEDIKKQMAELLTRIMDFVADRMDFNSVFSCFLWCSISLGRHTLLAKLKAIS